MSSTAASPEGFEPGDRVRPTSGDFSSFVGVVVELRAGLVIVEYDFFGEKVQVEHHPGDLVRGSTENIAMSPTTPLKSVGAGL